MINRFFKDIAEDNELSGGAVRLLSLFFLVIAAVLSVLEYTQPPTWWDWISSSVWPWRHAAHERHVRFLPDLVNGMIGLALVAPLYMRGILKWKTSAYSIMSFGLIMLVFASFVTMALGGGGTKNEYVRGALLSAVVLSWFGMRSIAGIGWLLALGSGIYTMTSNSIAMGFHGFLYVISGTLGLLLHSGLGPGGLVQGLIAEYSPTARRTLEASRGDVGAFGDSVGRIASTAARIGLPGG